MTQYDVIVELQKECSNWEAKYLKVTTEMYDDIQKLRAERDQLKEQKGIVENACQDWRDKAESAEAEVKTLDEDIDKFEEEAASHYKLWCEQEARLAKAQELRQYYARQLSRPQISVAGWRLSEP